MGRVGRLALRAALDAAERPGDDPRSTNRLDVVHLNEIKGGAAATAHLLEFDSVQERWRTPIATEDNAAIVIGNGHLDFSAHAGSGEIPWGSVKPATMERGSGQSLHQAYCLVDGRLALVGHYATGAVYDGDRREAAREPAALPILSGAIQFPELNRWQSGDRASAADCCLQIRCARQKSKRLI